MSSPISSRPGIRTRLRDIARLAFSAGFSHTAALLALPLLQRFCYGPAAFADMAAYTQVVGIMGAVATLRMDLALVKQSEATAAKATANEGLRFLFLTTGLAALLPWLLKAYGFDAGNIPLIWIWLPLGVLALGINGLVSGWLSREERFGHLAGVRAGGGVAGEVMRFAAAPMGHAGLIAGRIAGQCLSALAGISMVWKGWREAGPEIPSVRKEVWKKNRNYARFTAPANILAMAANGLFILYLFEVCPSDFVGKVGAGMAYLTVGAGLIIRSVSDVFFKHLDDIPGAALRRHYLAWASGLIILASAGISTLWIVQDSWVIQWLGEGWAGMLNIMRIIALWMVPWIAGSSLSVVFPHLGLQSWTLKLDFLHLVMIAGLIGFTQSQTSAAMLTETEALQFLMRYTALQAGFYVMALAMGIVATGRKTSD